MYTGESRDRGQAMVDLMAQYEQHGLQLDNRELPIVCRCIWNYLAQLPKSEALEGFTGYRADSGAAPAHVCNSVTAVMRYAVRSAVKTANTVIGKRQSG